MAKSGQAKLGKAAIGRLAAISLIVAVLAYYSFAAALTAVARTKNYQVSLVVDPADSMALAAKADAIFLANKDPVTARRVQQLARASLESQPLNARALRLMGYTDQVLSAKPKSQQLIGLATQASRRELGAQMWLIEQRVARNDAVGALRHYDLALRTNAAIQVPLYTQLTLGIEIPVIRSALTPYVKAETPWIRPFLTHAIWYSANPLSIVAVVNAAGGMPKAKPFRETEILLLSQLVGKQQLAVAREFYLGLPNAKPGVLTSLTFVRESADLRNQALGWQLVQGASVGSAWSGNSEQQTLSIYANSGERGLVARKLLFLKPGSYRVGAKFGQSIMPESSSVQLTFYCANADNNDWAKRFTSAANRGGNELELRGGWFLSFSGGEYRHRRRTRSEWSRVDHRLYYDRA